MEFVQPRQILWAKSFCQSILYLLVWAIMYGHNFFHIFLTLLTMMVFIVIKGNFLLQHTLRAGTLTITKKSGFPHEQAFSLKMCHLIALKTVKNRLVWFPFVAFVSVILRCLFENSTLFHCFLFNKDLISKNCVALVKLKAVFGIRTFFISMH